MLLEGKADRMVSFPYSMCLWITWVAGCRMYETRHYVYAYWVVKRKADWSACLVSPMKISTEIVSLRQTSWFYDNGNIFIPIFWGAALPSKYIWKRVITAAHAKQCIDHQVPSYSLFKKRMPFIIKPVTHKGLTEVCCWSILLKSCTIYGLVAESSTVNRGAVHAH